MEEHYCQGKVRAESKRLFSPHLAAPELGGWSTSWQQELSYQFVKPRAPVSSREADISAGLLALLWAITALLVFHNTKGQNKGWTNIPWPGTASKLNMPQRDYAASCRLSSMTVQNQLLAPWGSLSSKGMGMAATSGEPKLGSVPPG